MLHSADGKTWKSVLGFGCGSVLGRVGRSASLRAMSTAWDAGITLFDTARSYGNGDAEAVLGEFLQGKRQQAVIATKFGISPQRQSRLKRMAVPVARAAMQMKVPGVRNLIRRGVNHEITSGEFTVVGLRESLETSLRALRTDYLNVLYLHQATASAMLQQDLMAALDDLVQEGKLLRAGLYADAAVIAEGIANGPATLSAMQFGADPFDPLVAAFTRHNQRDLLLIANHPFGSEQRVARMKAKLVDLSGDESVTPALREKLNNVDWQVLLEVIFGVALKAMGAHALVFSMMRDDHLQANVRAVESNRFGTQELVLIRERWLSSDAVESPTG
jgi:aryl-alcohol dehydrogenase-like predicted oxidoreductase